ncbi:low molecular weight protein-tyrosine-phosphatase [Carnobacterium gallinarum]|uniref:low molecular weight protein-tyrosine-phosphatase n=1 Tax=Carnobacterium gallinarum TaxID=2749 RepID=UPI000556BBBC|nr:low molecular weight protein-tyrosine-phosphatase [Carnobacterium gallinarum]
MVKLLYVCLGNICRSPMAEAFMQHAVTKAGLKDKFQIESAATSRWESGNPPHIGTKKILATHGIETVNMFSRQVTIADFNEFDAIYGMDRHNIEDLNSICPTEFLHKIHLFMDSVEGKQGLDVPDPWYTDNFALTYQLISEGCSAQLKQLQDTKLD